MGLVRSNYAFERAAMYKLPRECARRAARQSLMRRCPAAQCGR